MIDIITISNDCVTTVTMLTKWPSNQMVMLKYRIDNGGCQGVFVPGFGFKHLWDTVEEACDAARILHKNSNRKFPYEIVEVEPSTESAIRVVLTINED